jgi:hypothetical protein
MKNIYQILDEIDAATSKQEKMNAIERNLSKIFVEVLELAYHPKYEWLVKDMPENYLSPETPPKYGYAQMSTQIRKLYLFQKGNPPAEILTPQKREELLFQLLNSLEPREAEVIIGIFKKDLGVRGMDYKFVKEAFPTLLP